MSTSTPPSSSSSGSTSSSTPPSSSSTPSLSPPPSSSSSSVSLSSSSSGSSSSHSSSAPITSPSVRTSASLTTSFSNGRPITITSTVINTAAPTFSLPSTDTAPKGFFQNTGAVAGTFTVVGLAGIAIVVWVISTIIKRRRAKQFDREIAEAAREAATAPVPVFLDDDNDDYGPDRNQYGAGGYGYAAGYNDAYPSDPYKTASPGSGAPVDPAYSAYSDVSSHGTYGQPGLHETYQMAERNGGGYGYGQYDNNNYNVPVGGIMGAAGAAGIGVARARSTRDPGAALAEGGNPYAAFHGAYPQFDQQALNNNGNGMGAAAVARGSSPTANSTPSDLSRVKSNGSSSYYGSSTAPSSDPPIPIAPHVTGGSSPSHPQDAPKESYASHFAPGFNPTTHANPAANAYNLDEGRVELLRRKSQGLGGHAVTPVQDDNADAYDVNGYGGSDDEYARPRSGYVVRDSMSIADNELPNPFAAMTGAPMPVSHQYHYKKAAVHSPPPPADESDYEDDQDDGRKVLKVANT